VLSNVGKDEVQWRHWNEHNTTSPCCRPTACKKSAWAKCRNREEFLCQSTLQTVQLDSQRTGRRR